MSRSLIKAPQKKTIGDFNYEAVLKALVKVICRTISLQQYMTDYLLGIMHTAQAL